MRAQGPRGVCRAARFIQASATRVFCRAAKPAAAGLVRMSMGPPKRSTFTGTPAFFSRAWRPALPRMTADSVTPARFSAFTRSTK